MSLLSWFLLVKFVLSNEDQGGKRRRKLPRKRSQPRELDKGQLIIHHSGGDNDMVGSFLSAELLKVHSLEGG